MMTNPENRLELSQSVKVTIQRTLTESCNIMKRLFLIALSFTAPLAVMAQTTVYSDDFATDLSLASPPWYNMNNTANASATLVNGTGLELNVSGGTGKVNEEFGQFTPFASAITLNAVGDYITLTVDFTSANIAGNNGYLLAGLYNDNGTTASGTLTTTATGGATAAYTGYFGDMGLNTSAGSSTKFYSRTGGASDANELAYYSSMTGSSYTQIGSSIANTANGTIANNKAYTLTFTVTKTAAGSDTVTAQINQGATIVDSAATWTFLDASGTYNTFDELDFGFYGKSAPINGTITDVVVTDQITPTPEPSTFALAGLGMLGLVLARRMRR
jgi:hypothetical protein